MARTKRKPVAKRKYRKRKPSTDAYDRVLQTRLRELRAEQELENRNSAAHIRTQIRDLELRLATVDPHGRRWPMGMFNYAARVRIVPLQITARVIEVHNFGQAHTIEYGVRYWLDDRPVTVRVFEDELEADTRPDKT